MSTNADAGRVTASEAASVLQDPLGLTGAPMPDGSPPERGWMAGRLIDGFELAIDGGRSPRMLVLDWHGANGSRGRVSSGVTLEYLARSGLGLPAEHLRSPDQRQH